MLSYKEYYSEQRTNVIDLQGYLREQMERFMCQQADELDVVYAQYLWCQARQNPTKETVLNFLDETSFVDRNEFSFRWED